MKLILDILIISIVLVYSAIMYTLIFLYMNES